MIKQVFLGIFFFLSVTIGSNAVFAARYVPIKIYLDGEVILEGNASDNGKPDADEVWDALKRVNLGETNAFKKYLGEEHSEERAIDSKTTQEIPGIRIFVAYGGVAETAKLTIQRKPPDSAGRVWRISKVDVERLASSRMVRRTDVTRLANPKQQK